MMINKSLIFSFYFLSVLLAQGGRIHGFITDKETGEALIGANVFIRETGKGMATDKNGYYVINNITGDSLTLAISYLGYQSYENQYNFSASNNYTADIALSSMVIESDVVDVSAEKITRKFNIQPGRVNLSTKQIRSLPSILEPDIFRTIQSLPGVLTQSEFSTGLIIRGGNTDQNLILLDGITVYNPSHLGGVFSNFIVDAVKDAELIKGGYNAEYGGRLSAVLNVTSREGNRNKVDASTSISLLSAQTTIEGPFYKGAWLLSGRRTYFDQILKNTSLNVPPYYFYDLQSHVFSDLTPKDRLSFSFYRGLDDLVFDDLGLDAEWGNKTYSMSYRRLFSDLLIGNFLIASSQFRTYFNLGGDSGLIEDNVINDVTVSANFTWFQNNGLTWKFGAQIKQLGFSYDNSFADTSLFVINKKPVESAIYNKWKWVLSEKFIVEPGLRLNVYDAHSDRYFPDVRLGMKYLVTEDRYINFAIGNYHQFIQTIQDDFNPTILDFWVAVDESVQPGKSQQVVLGYEEYIGRVYKTQIEVYYKHLENMLTFVESRSSTEETLSDEKISDNFQTADGFAYGLEVFAQKTFGKLNGWISYTLGISRKILDGKEYFTNWDRRHAISVIGNYQFTDKWELNLQWSYQSGQAFTPILGYFIEDLDFSVSSNHANFRTIPGGRNTGRYPAYHRLDLGAIRHFSFKKFDMDIFIQIINSYDRNNIFRYVYHLGSTYNGVDDDGDWDIEKHDTNGNGYPDYGGPNVDEPDEGIVQRTDISIFPLIPSVGFSIRF